MLHTWASVLEERVCLDDTLRRGLRYWRHHGAPIVFWAGWTLFGSRLYAEFFVLFANLRHEPMLARTAVRTENK